MNRKPAVNQGLLAFFSWQELMEHFHPVFRHFFLERFPDPAVWFERRLSYTRGVATSSIGMLIRFVAHYKKSMHCLMVSVSAI